MKGKPLSDEQKARMREGRRLAREKRAQAAPSDEALLQAPLDDAFPPEEQDSVIAVLNEDAEKAERRRRLLGDLDAETAALFTDDDLLRIEAEEREKALALKKRQAIADVRAEARQQAEVDYGLIPADRLRSEEEKRRLSERVRIRVSLPSDGAGHLGQNGFRIDGRLYQDGHEYTVTRAQLESMQDTQFRAYLNEYRFRTLDQQQKGKSAQENLGRVVPRLEVVHG